MSRKKKIKIFKILLMAVVLTLFIGITVYLFPVMKNLSTVEGQVAFKEKVDNSGMMGMLSLFGLQISQIFLIIVPGEPIEILVRDRLAIGDWKMSIILYVAILILVAIVVLIINKFDKDKITKDAINSIK